MIDKIPVMEYDDLNKRKQEKRKSHDKLFSNAAAKILQKWRYGPPKK